jgi:hypothetical protein
MQHNSVKSCENLLQNKTVFFGAMRANRGIPHVLEREAESMAKGQSFLHRKGILVRVWKDKQVVFIISTVHDSKLKGVWKNCKAYCD